MSLSPPGDHNGVDAGRLARALVFLVWATFFAYLWISGEVTRYLGPRTQWVVLFGTIVLAIAAIAHLFSLRRGHAARLTWGQGLGYLLTILPIAVVIMAPDAELGALAASRKLSGTEIGKGQIVIPADRSGPVSFIDLYIASRSPEYAKSAGIEVGDAVDLIGFVTHGGQEDGFRLTRFYISCCAADAIPYWVSVTPADTAVFQDDTWLHVEGVIAQGPDGYFVTANDIEEVEEPDPPYLY
jgi:putative membrane protein